MERGVKIIIKCMFLCSLLAMVFAVGLQIGQRTGFATGSEWAIVQADIVAREAGLTMPVTLESGNFRVTLHQPRNLYKTAWKLADRHEAATMRDVEEDEE